MLTLAIVFVHPNPQLLPVGSTAPPVRLRDTAGSLETVVPQPARRPVVVVFFETTCATCAATAPGLCRIREQHREVAVAVVESGSGDAAGAAAFARRNAGCGVPFLLDPDLRVSRSYAVSVVPLAYVVDSHGKISYSGIGAAGMGGLLPHLTHVPGG